MGLEGRLELKLSQKLVLTPQLQQAIRLLQLPQLELSQTINEELIENPFLEETVDDTGPADLSSDENSGEDLGPYEDYETPLDGLKNFTIDEYFEEKSSDGRDLGYFNPGLVEKPSFETFLSSKLDLTDHLMWQLGLSYASEELKMIAEMVIGNIDENGYLRASDEELANVLELAVEKVEKAIHLVQSFDPPGVCSRDLKECLKIQLKLLQLNGTFVEKIVENNLGDLEKKKYQVIANKYKTLLDDVIAAVKIIENLEPKPGRSFSKSHTSYVVTDVTIEKLENEYRIILNDDSVPRVNISSKYKEYLADKKNFEKDDKQFLLEKYRAAVWLLKSIDQRNKTIYRVTESILKSQIEFFEKGIQYLKPLNLRDVATDIDMHESNISRVTSNKYLACSHGIFPFKFFFSGSVAGQNGSVSSTSVKDLIKKIVDSEKNTNPLTDREIVEMLEKKNIKIARRTLAKYREELKIPSHTKRKRLEL